MMHPPHMLRPSPTCLIAHNAVRFDFAHALTFLAVLHDAEGVSTASDAEKTSSQTLSCQGAHLYHLWSLSVHNTPPVRGIYMNRHCKEKILYFKATLQSIDQRSPLHTTNMQFKNIIVALALAASATAQITTATNVSTSRSTSVTTS